MRRILYWIPTIPLLVAIGLTLLIGDPLMRIISLFGREPLQKAFFGVQRLLVPYFVFVRLRVEVERSDLVDPEARYVFVSNHQSNFDIPLLGWALHRNRPMFIANRSLRRWIPTVSFLLRKLQQATIDPSQPREALREIRNFGRHVAAAGDSAIIFPEGTRARDGVLKEYRVAGTATLLKAAGLPVVPVVIDGASDLMEHGLFPTPFGATVRLHIGAPLEKGDPAEVLAEARRYTESVLNRWRGDAAT